MSTPRTVRHPEGVRRVTVATQRGDFAALRADPPAGTTRLEQVLLVPGYSGSKEDFLAVLVPIAAAGHPVVAIDLRGQYETPGPVALDAYTTKALAADVRAIVDVLVADGGPVHLLGHSFGGLVSRALLLDDPAGVSSCTLLDSGPGSVAGLKEKQAKLMVAVVGRLGPPAVRLAVQKFATLGSRPPADVIEFLRERYVRSQPFALIAMARSLLTEPDLVDELAAVDRPTLVAYGDRDDVWTADLQADMAARLGARHEVLAGIGHSPNVDAPLDLTARLVAFWADATAGRTGAAATGGTAEAAGDRAAVDTPA